MFRKNVKFFLVFILVLVGSNIETLAENNSWTKPFTNEQWKNIVADANKSDLYGKTTNGQSNDVLIRIARDYIAKNPVAFGENSESRLNLEPSWFASHAPEIVRYLPVDTKSQPYIFTHESGFYTIVWLETSSCEKYKGGLISKEDFPCIGGTEIRVTINDLLKPKSIAYDLLR